MESFRLVALSLIGLAFGLLISLWAIAAIVRYFRAPAERRPAMKPVFRIAWIAALIGLASLSKAAVDALKLFKPRPPTIETVIRPPLPLMLPWKTVTWR